MPRALGAILAGGRSSRFGADKARAAIDGRPMIAHVAEVLGRQVDHAILCGRDYPETGLEWIADRPAPDLGPLGGLNAALHWAFAQDFDIVVTAGCDMPDLPGDLVARLREVGPCVIDAEVPLIGLWPAALAPMLDHHLAASTDRSLRCWARVAGATVESVAPGLANINTRANLAAFAIRS
jgi:molybdenum cofactor guanylyltransferase